MRYIWTSGRKCNFNGCDRQDLLPQNVNGWFWSGSGAKIGPTTQRNSGDWSHTGGYGQPQPDNREAAQVPDSNYSKILSCLHRWEDDMYMIKCFCYRATTSHACRCWTTSTTTELNGTMWLVTIENRSSARTATSFSTSWFPEILAYAFKIHATASSNSWTFNFWKYLEMEHLFRTKASVL